MERGQNTVLAAEGVIMDIAKLKTLQKWQMPKNRHDLIMTETYKSN